MKKLCLSVVSAALIVSAPASFSAVPGPSCSVPSIPKLATLDTPEKLQKFAKTIEKYQNCLMNYSAKHKKLSQDHAAAANSAVDTWNKFSAKLNAAK